MSTVTLALTASAFSVNPAWTVEQFHQNLISSISASTTSSLVMLGQVGGSAPVSNVGPWLNGTTWFAWNGSSYVPATIKVGDATYQTTLSGTPTVNRVITLPDASGTLALTSDTTRATVTVVDVAGTSTIDWSASNSFALSLTGNTTIANTNSLAGQKVTATIYNPAAHTVTWPATVLFSGADPTQSTGGKTDQYYMENVAGQIYCRYLQDFA